VTYKGLSIFDILFKTHKNLSFNQIILVLLQINSIRSPHRHEGHFALIVSQQKRKSMITDEEFTEIWDATIAPTIGTNEQSPITNGVSDGTADLYINSANLSDADLLKKIIAKEI